ncbi:MAG: hypothetical protein QM763_15195 [Agriterribacter sp.]
MKVFLLFTICRLLSSPPDSLYGISFDTFNGATVSMSSFKGRSVVIIVLDNKRPGIKYLTTVDSLAKRSLSSAVVILVPAADIDADSTKQSAEISNAGKELSERKIVTAKEMNVKKKSAEKQHPLFQWLTNAKLNGHFDNDVVSDGQMYMINEKGILYGVHEAQLSGKTVTQVITQKRKE